eukprot:6323482-Heterocapsa_arctica.AAC.1
MPSSAPPAEMPRRARGAARRQREQRLRQHFHLLLQQPRVMQSSHRRVRPSVCRLRALWLIASSASG